MARPNKQGIDYFSLDVVLDDKFELFEAEHGLKGFAFLIKLFQKIYESNGYFYSWTEDEQLLFAKRINVDINLINEYINSAIKREIFNKEMYETYKILTSRGIQKRFLEAVKRRKQIEVRKEYFLIDIKSENYKEFVNKIVYVSNNLINVNINSENIDNNTTKGVNNNPQSKVKESKVKEITTTTNINNIKDIEKTEEIKKSVVVELDSVEEYYKNNIDELSDYSKLFIKTYRDKKVSDDLIIYAMQCAVEQNKKTIAYIKGTLNNWEADDITSVLEAKQAAENFKKNNKKNNSIKKAEFEQRTYKKGELDKLYANK